jgi:hypothetical protein
MKLYNYTIIIGKDLLMMVFNMLHLILMYNIKMMKIKNNYEMMLNYKNIN